MAASNVVTNPSFSGSTSGAWITGTTSITAVNINQNTLSTPLGTHVLPAYNFKTPKYWWKYTHYECPLCGSVDTVRERVNVVDQAKPEDENDRHTDVVIACGFHFT